MKEVKSAAGDSLGERGRGRVVEVRGALGKLITRGLAVEKWTARGLLAEVVLEGPAALARCRTVLQGRGLSPVARGETEAMRVSFS